MKKINIITQFSTIFLLTHYQFYNKLKNITNSLKYSIVTYLCIYTSENICDEYETRNFKKDEIVQN